jgi:O-acetyl-ADP-ribose deacetylase
MPQPDTPFSISMVNPWDTSRDIERALNLRGLGENRAMILDGTGLPGEVVPVAHLEIVIASITEQEVDAIVNSASTGLVMGSGVAAAILAEAGPEVEEEAIAQGPVMVGDIVVTSGGDLPVHHILHVAVVGKNPPDIYECTFNVLERAVELGVHSIAIPALGTGSAGVPVREAARRMCEAIVDFLSDDSTLSEIRIVLWDAEYFERFDRALRRARRGHMETRF